MSFQNYNKTKKTNNRIGIKIHSAIESHGPAGKVRGTVQQLAERYLTLGRDALREGETIVAEGFLQHAEHYQRIIGAFKAQGGDISGDGASQESNRKKQHEERESKGERKQERRNPERKEHEKRSCEVESADGASENCTIRHEDDIQNSSGIIMDTDMWHSELPPSSRSFRPTSGGRNSQKPYATKEHPNPSPLSE